MKKIVFVLFTVLSLSAYGQKNILHDPSFWINKPSIDKIKNAIDLGSSPSEADPYGADATVYAINAASPLSIIQFMLAQPGNEVNKRVSNGRTYLYSAASKGNVALMEYLISKGATLNIKDNFGYTVLNYAAATGQTNTKVYDLCIKNGSDPKKEIINGGANALLLLAPYDEDFSLINYFITKGVDVKSTDSTGLSAFDYAVKKGNVKVLKELVAKGVKYQPDAMVTASIGMWGGKAAPLELYQYLETLKLNPKATNINKDNALHFVVRNSKQDEVIKYFISKGLTINQENNDGITPFMNAVSANKDLLTINNLLGLVKHINHQNKQGVSALSLAVKSNTADVVNLLLEKGADVKVVDKEGYTLTHYLIPNFAQAPDIFENKLKLLQAKGFNFSLRQGNGDSLYHMALMENDLKLFKRIESFKVDVNAKNKEGLTPLHKAAMIANSDVIMKYLLSIGAKVDLKTSYGETAYDLAKENEYLTKQKITIDFLK